MLLSLLKRRHRITSDSFAQMLWKFSCLGSINLYDLLKPRLTEAGYKLSSDEDSRFFREVVIADLWIVHKSLRADRNVLRALHQIASLGGQDAPEGDDPGTKEIRFSECELRERFETYDAVCGDNSGGPLMLSVTMLERMLPGQRASLNAMLGFLIVVHITNGIRALLKLRSGYNITD